METAVQNDKLLFLQIFECLLCTRIPDNFYADNPLSIAFNAMCYKQPLRD